MFRFKCNQDSHTLFNDFESFDRDAYYESRSRKAQTILAGSFKFCTVEIEVFAISK